MEIGIMNNTKTFSRRIILYNKIGLKLIKIVSKISHKLVKIARGVMNPINNLNKLGKLSFERVSQYLQKSIWLM